MAGIGDYIHYHIENYRDYGTTFKGTDNSNFISAYANNHEKLKRLVNTKNVSEEQCKKLSSFYTDLFYNTSTNGLLNKIITVDGQQESLSQLIADVLKNYSNADGANYADEILVNKVLNQRISKLANTVKSKAAETGSKISNVTLNRYVSSINQMKKNAEKAFNSNQGLGNFNKLYPSMEALNKTIESLDKDLSNVISSLEMNSGFSNKKRKTNLRYFKTDSVKSQLASIYERYWDLIRWYQGSFGGAFAGDTSEIAAALGEVVSAGKTVFTSNEIKNLLESVWKGNDMKQSVKIANGLSMQVSKSFSQAMNNKKSQLVNYTYNTNTSAGEFSVTANFMPGAGAKGLIDIIINPTSDKTLEEKLGVSDLAASLKNYSDVSASYGNSNGVKIVDETPLLSLLSENMDTDFVNHYLNLLGAHDSSGNKIVGDRKALIEGRKEIKYSGAISGLVGRHGSNRNNDVLIINDKMTKHVYVMPVQKLDDNEKLLMNAITMKIAPEVYGTNASLNKWASGKISRASAQGRIERYFATLHNSKVTMSLKSSGIFDKDLFV